MRRQKNCLKVSRQAFFKLFRSSHADHFSFSFQVVNLFFYRRGIVNFYKTRIQKMPVFGETSIRDRALLRVMWLAAGPNTPRSSRYPRVPIGAGSFGYQIRQLTTAWPRTASNLGTGNRPRIPPARAGTAAGSF